MKKPISLLLYTVFLLSAQHLLSKTSLYLNGYVDAITDEASNKSNLALHSATTQPAAETDSTVLANSSSSSNNNNNVEKINRTLDKQTNEDQESGSVYKPKDRKKDLLVQRSKCTRNASKFPHSRVFNDGNILRMKLQEDDILYGRSCVFFQSNDDRHNWTCRDCGTECKYTNYEECPVMNRTHFAGCSPFPRISWDEPSLVATKHQAHSPGNSHYEHVYQNHLKREQEGSYLERLPCKGGVLDPECFDLTKCDPHGPMKVYVYGENKGQGANYTHSLVRNHPGLIDVVTNASESCLKVVACDRFSSWQGEEKFSLEEDHVKLMNNPDWDEGRNHFIWKSYRCFHDHTDYIRTPGITFQRASTSMPNLNRIQIRSGYDIPIAYYRPKEEEELSIEESQVSNLDIHRPRKYLVSFKGTHYKTMHYWGMHHRWLAAEFWPRGDDVFIETICRHRGIHKLSVTDYIQVLQDSAFAFCPGGLSQGSYRFHEALALGAIPVVTNDFMAPFEPDLDWSGCVVRVSEARVLEIPRLLREMYAPADIRERQAGCRALFENAVGWDKSGSDKTWRIDHGRQGFEMAIKLWASKVKTGFAKLQQIESMLDPPGG